VPAADNHCQAQTSPQLVAFVREFVGPMPHTAIRISEASIKQVRAKFFLELFKLIRKVSCLRNDYFHVSIFEDIALPSLKSFIAPPGNRFQKLNKHLWPGLALLGLSLLPQ
jgi:hypothetical protein